jgi:hypothetical protein
MVTITLPPELERVVTERAKRQGTTPELWTLDRLSQSLQAELAIESVPEPTSEDGTMLDFFAGYVGVLQSSEFVPGGAQMSQNTGRKFAEGMMQKRQEGKL